MNITISNYKILSALALEQGYNVGWYESANAEIKRRSAAANVRVDVYAAIVAALSPLVRWRLNLDAADSLIAGAPNSAIPGFDYNKEKARRILQERDPELLSGPKVVPFYRSLMLENLPSDVTIDIWMLRASEHATRVATNYSRYTKVQREECRTAVLYVAEGLGYNPRAAQAMVWQSIREVWPTVAPYVGNHDLFDIARYRHLLD